MSGSIFPLEVQPRLPEELSRLTELANDLVYTWERAIRSLFSQIDTELWHRCGHNPKVFLRRVSQEKLDDAVRDHSYMEFYRRVLATYDSYLDHRGRPEIWEVLEPQRDLIAYFCLEFGFHESFPIYSGGLGILAGDHCKAASDIGLPFVAVGLLYEVGYFTQTIDAFGHQQALYNRTYPHDLPIVPTRTEDGAHLVVDLEFPGRTLKVQVWTAKVGHIDLYLLDTNLPENTPEDRAITHQLYGGEREMRLEQELVLGLGGVRILRELGLRPAVWHINEGHAAFQILERCRITVQDHGLDFASALEWVAAGTVFTTHTPVPAGHDIFDQALLAKYLTPLAGDLGVSFEELAHLGSENGGGFNMTSLALRGSRFHNGVSRTHGGVASEMESNLWPQIPADENPITYVTNGVHLQTFLARDWVSLFDLRFDDWRNQLLNEDYWECIEEIPDYHYWSVHKALKQQLLQEVSERLSAQEQRNGTSAATIDQMTRYIDSGGEDVLVMGFARRFATYKRATMLFADPERLARLLSDPERPVVIIFAGKAHPKDQPGQHLIQTIHDFSMRPEFIGRILLLEGYDLALGRHLVSGVDVWLNTPEYPMEASGTSGQKAGMNGAVNLSVLDGWWGEGFNGANGYTIRPCDSRFNPEHRYAEEAGELLNTIEYQVMPTYFHRNGHGFSAEWVSLSKASMKSIIPRFNAQRMLMDYVHDLYSVACRQSLRYGEDEAKLAREVAAWKKQVREAWPDVVMELTVQPSATIYQDQRVILGVRVRHGELNPRDLKLECLLGQKEGEEFRIEQLVELEPGASRDGCTEFSLEFYPGIPGLQWYKLRLYPWHEALSHPFELGCMLWV